MNNLNRKSIDMGPENNKRNDYNKIIVLTGNDKEARNRLIHLLSDGKERVVIDRHHSDKKGNYWHNYIEKDTEVIIFEDINIRNGKLERFFGIFGPVTVQRKEFTNLFTISPLIIIDALVWDQHKYEGGSYTGRFDFFNLTK